MPGELGPMQNAARPNSQVLSPLAVLGDWRGSRPPRPRLRSLWHTCFQQKGGKGENWGREFYPNKRIPSEAGHDASTASWTGRNCKMPLKSWKPPRGGAESLRANQKEEVQFFREIAAFWLGWPLREGGTGLQIHPKPDLWISLFAASSAARGLGGNSPDRPGGASPSKSLRLLAAGGSRGANQKSGLTRSEEGRTQTRQVGRDFPAGSQDRGRNPRLLESGIHLRTSGRCGWAGWGKQRQTPEPSGGGGPVSKEVHWESGPGVVSLRPLQRLQPLIHLTLSVQVMSKSPSSLDHTYNPEGWAEIPELKCGTWEAIWSNLCGAWHSRPGV